MSNLELRNQRIKEDFEYLIKCGFKIEMVSNMVAFRYFLSADRAYKIYREESVNNEEIEE